MSLKEGSSCLVCRWWDEFDDDVVLIPAYGPAEGCGVCRVAAPTTDDRTGAAMWPITEEADWCGRFQIHEKMKHS